MKRGLVVLDPEETPVAELKGRTAALQASLTGRGAVAALVYGDVYRSGDITYLSNICIYWNEALLAVPTGGAPALLTKLSRRVHPWMRATSSLEDLRSGPNLAALAAEWLGATATAAGAVGLVERDWWPAPLVGALERELPDREIVDLGGIVRARRELPAPGEVSLLGAGAALSSRAVAETLTTSLTNAERAGKAELTARRGGVEDVAVHAYAAGPGIDVVEVIGEYRGYWTAASRVLAHGYPAFGRAMDEAYRAAAGALRADATPGAVGAAAASCLAGLGLTWRLELLHHVDVESGGAYRLPGARERPFPAGSVASLRLAIDLPEGRSAVAGDTYLVGPSTAERLTAELPEPAIVALG